jgi:hypothetical protein
MPPPPSWESQPPPSWTGQQSLTPPGYPGYPGQTGYAGYPGYGGYGPAPPRTDGLAVTALVLAIGSVFLCPFLAAIAALVVAAQAGRRIQASGGALGGAGMVKAARVVAIVGMALWAVLFAVIAAVAVNDGSIEFGTRTALEDLEVGDCFDAPSQAIELRGVDTTSCNEDHGFEVYAVIGHPAPDGASYPGRQAVQSFAGRACQARFEGFVGVPLQSSRLKMQYLYPLEDDWRIRDVRSIACAAGPGDGSKLTGSVRNSRR